MSLIGIFVRQLFRHLAPVSSCVFTHSVIIFSCVLENVIETAVSFKQNSIKNDARENPSIGSQVTAKLFLFKPRSLRHISLTGKPFNLKIRSFLCYFVCGEVVAILCFCFYQFTIDKSSRLCFVFVIEQTLLFFSTQLCSNFLA